MSSCEEKSAFGHTMCGHPRVHPSWALLKSVQNVSQGFSPKNPSGEEDDPCGELPLCVCSACSAAKLCPILCDPTDCINSQAPLSLGFPRQEYWSGQPFPSLGDLPDPGIEPTSPASPARAGWFFTIEHLESPPVGADSFALPGHMGKGSLLSKIKPASGHQSAMKDAWPEPKRRSTSTRGI